MDELRLTPLLPPQGNKKESARSDKSSHPTHHQEDVRVAADADPGPEGGAARRGVLLPLGAAQEREEEAGLDELVPEDGGAERGHQQVEAAPVAIHA